MGLTNRPTPSTSSTGVIGTVIAAGRQNHCTVQKSGKNGLQESQEYGGNHTIFERARIQCGRDERMHL
jgi:hypothetical protein